MATTAAVLGGLAIQGALSTRKRGHGPNSYIRGTETSLEQAINAFYNEYERLPDPRVTPVAADAIVDTGSAEGVRLLTILLGRETGTTIQNPKKIAFLTVMEGKKGKDGLIYEGDRLEGLFDPFGQGYRVMIDYGGDEQITVPRESGTTGTLHMRHAAVYSLGLDGKGGREAVRNW